MSTKSTVFMQALFKEQHAGVCRFIASKVSDPHEAEDLAQDAFHNMMKLDQLEQLENPKAYLYQAAANLAMNRIRKQRRQQRCEHFLKADIEIAQTQTANTPDTIVASRQQLELVMAALQQLPEKVKTAFLLSRAEHKSYTDISEEMGVSVSSVEKYLMTALKHLRSLEPPQR